MFSYIQNKINMLRTYTPYKRLIARILLLSIFLQSCNNPIVPISPGKGSKQVELKIKQEKVVNKKSALPTIEKESLDKIAYSAQLAIPLLGGLKRKKPFPKSYYSKSSLLGYKKLLNPTKRSFFNLQGSKYEKKVTKVAGSYKSLWRNLRIGSKQSYYSPKTNFTHSGLKTNKVCFSRSYTTNHSLSGSSIGVSKKFLLKVGTIGAIAVSGTLAYTVCSSNKKHTLDKDNTTTTDASVCKEKYYAPEEDTKEQDTQPLTDDYRPSDWVHLHYAVQSYQNNGGELLKSQNWELLDTYSNIKDSYFGSAYRNDHIKHIIIAHRGTENIKDWLTNLRIITEHIDTKQESSAWEFSKKIIEQYGADYSYSFTGHSLGGWLALACLYKYKDKFINGSPTDGYSDGFAVTFDDPGGEQLLKALQPNVGLDMDLSDLDITSYLSYPNLVNTAMGRKDVGSVYGVSPEMISTPWYVQGGLQFTVKTHDKQLLLNSFSKHTGLPKICGKIISWPRINWDIPLSITNNVDSGWGFLKLILKEGIEDESGLRKYFLGFYKYGISTGHNSKNLSPEDKFKLEHKVHYLVEEFDAQKLPLRNMPELERRFLLDLSEYSNRAEIVNNLTGTSVDVEVVKLLKGYHIDTNHNEIVVDKSATNTTAREFRDKILNYLKKNPALYQKKLSVAHAELLAERIKNVQTNDHLVNTLNDLSEHCQHTKQLIHELSFKQATARLYKFIKPTWKEIKELKDEKDVLDKQLDILKNINLKVQSLSFEQEISNQLKDTLQLETEQLKFAKKSVDILLMYMEEKLHEADKELDTLINTLEKEETCLPNLDKKIMLNRGYNLKAKIAARGNNKDLSADYYEKATKLWPQDLITWSNYGGLLTDRGRSEKKPKLHIQAYRCYQEVYPRIKQIELEQLPVVHSGMAYGFILLAEAIEKGEISIAEKAELPKVKKLRTRAENLLKGAIQADPTYVNARLFSAILFYDQGNYGSALEEINNVLSIDPVHKTGLMRKGRILHKLGNSGEAIDLLNEARGWLQLEKGNDSWITEIDTILAEIRKPD